MQKFPGWADYINAYQWHGVTYRKYDYPRGAALYDSPRLSLYVTPLPIGRLEPGPMPAGLEQLFMLIAICPN